MMLYLLLVLAVMTHNVEAGEKTKYHAYRVEYLTSYTGAYFWQDHFLFKVIMDFGDSPWFIEHPAVGCDYTPNPCWKLKPVEYADQSKEAYGVILGFLVEYNQRGSAVRTLHGMRLGTTTFADHPHEVPACAFANKPLKDKDVIACVYNRDDEENDVFNRIKRSYSHVDVEVYTSLNDYTKWKDTVIAAMSK